MLSLLLTVRLRGLFQNFNMEVHLEHVTSNCKNSLYYYQHLLDLYAHHYGYYKLFAANSAACTCAAVQPGFNHFLSTHYSAPTICQSLRLPVIPTPSGLAARCSTMQSLRPTRHPIAAQCSVPSTRALASPT